MAIKIQSMEALLETAKAMLAKGILAMDESISTCNKRFALLDIPQTVEYRKNFRELLATTPGLGDCISAAILSDETIHQQVSNGKTFAEILTNSEIIPGIKVDKGAKDLAAFPGEKVTEGLDNLRTRLQEYKQLGARFAKWRAVITIGTDIPSLGCISTNVNALARYASLCQEVGLVPMVEPEVLMDGKHDIKKCAEVTELVHRMLFQELYLQRINLRAMILKPNMILPGNDSVAQEDDKMIAKTTIECFLRSVPAAVPGIAFLSGGQPSEKATSRLNEMHSNNLPDLPWALTFSFSRAIEYPALQIWSGKKENLQAAQKALYHRACCDFAARNGQYNVRMEKEGCHIQDR